MSEESDTNQAALAKGKKPLPPGSAFLIGISVVSAALMLFAGYLFYRSQQVSLNTGALILIPLVGAVILWFLLSGKRDS